MKGTVWLFTLECLGPTLNPSQSSFSSPSSSLFQRLDAFLERSHDMMDMMITCTQFNKLERVEIGGTKGKVLTNGVKAIHADFTAAVERFKVWDHGSVGQGGMNKVGQGRRERPDSEVIAQ